MPSKSTTRGSSSVMFPAINKISKLSYDRTHRVAEGGELEQRLRQGSLYGDMKVVSAALADGAVVDASDQFGNTALMLAATRGRLPVIRELLKAGADMDQVCGDGGTCLHVAARWGQVQAVEEFLRRGADATFEDKNGRTASAVCRNLVKADPNSNPEGVHPKSPVYSSSDDGASYMGGGHSPSGGSVAGSQYSQQTKLELKMGMSWNTSDNDSDGGSLGSGTMLIDEAAEEAALSAMRRAKQDAFALANACHQLNLSNHEHALQMLENWERAASDAMAAQEAVDHAEDYASTVVDSTLDEILARVKELCLTIDAKHAEIEELDSREEEVMMLIGQESQEIGESEATLKTLVATMAQSEGQVLAAQNRRKLASYDFAKTKLTCQEKEIEVARHEGRMELKAELEAELPALKKEKRKSYFECRALLRAKNRRQPNASGSVGGGRNTARPGLDESSLAEHNSQMMGGGCGTTTGRRGSVSNGEGGVQSSRRGSINGDAQFGGLSRRGSFNGDAQYGLSARRGSINGDAQFGGMSRRGSFNGDVQYGQSSRRGSFNESNSQYSPPQPAGRRGSGTIDSSDFASMISPIQAAGRRGSASSRRLSVEDNGPASMLGSNTNMSYESMQEVEDAVGGMRSSMIPRLSLGMQRRMSGSLGRVSSNSQDISDFDNYPAPLLSSRSGTSFMSDMTPRTGRSGMSGNSGSFVGDEDDVEREVFAFEGTDRFKGLVPLRLVLKDDGWRVLDELRRQITSLRSQVRSLGEKPHC